MNKAKIIELLQDGAYLNIVEGRLYHPSFIKGYRSMHCSDISFCAAKRILKDRLTLADGIYKLA